MAGRPAEGLPFAAFAIQLEDVEFGSSMLVMMVVRLLRTTDQLLEGHKAIRIEPTVRKPCLASGSDAYEMERDSIAAGGVRSVCGVQRLCGIHCMHLASSVGEGILEGPLSADADGQGKAGVVRRR